MAPVVVGVKAQPNDAVGAAMSAQLLVLVDERGVARRVLIVRDQRDSRSQQIERLGFRSLTSAAVVHGSVDEATRALFAAGEAKGLAVTYLQSSGRWNPTMDAALHAELAPVVRSSAQASFSSREGTDVEARIAEVNAALRVAEDNMNRALDVVCGAYSHGPRAVAGLAAVYAHGDDEGDCDELARAALIESAEFTLAAGALVGALELCGTTLGIGCVLVPAAYVMHQKEGGEMVAASSALLKCLRPNA
jgi:hypothetical protein